MSLLKKVLSRVDAIPDERGRQLIRDALEWAIDNPDAIESRCLSKRDRKMHMPNMIGFASLLRGIEDRSNVWKVPVTKIIHDRQDEFRSLLADWHETYANASPAEFYLPFQGLMSMRAVPGSEFFVECDTTPGLQAIDVALWLLRRKQQCDVLKGGCRRLYRFVEATAVYDEISLEATERTFIKDVSQLNPLTATSAWRGNNLLKKAEAARLERLSGN